MRRLATVAFLLVLGLNAPALAASAANTALLYNLGLIGFAVEDNLSAKANNTQAGATPVNGEVAHVLISSASQNSLILKSVITGDAAPLTFIVNDGASAINVFPAVGEQNNGGVNTGLAVPAGQGAIFVRVPSSVSSSITGWRSSVIP